MILRFRAQVLLVIFLFSNIFVFGQKQDNKNLPRPKLVVGIVIDQMRWDYLYRYYDRYEQGGFKRLINEGFSCENTYINYIPTVTAIGHTTIYTGSIPSIDGITGNEFIINATGKSIYCAGDSTEHTIGSNSHEGEMSPRNLLVSTITDELRLATNFRSKVIGVALKDRASILPAGHAANAAYWFDNKTGNWITSSYYMKDLPKWVKAFNEKRLPDKYLKQNWNTLYDIKTYVQSTADDNAYEGKFPGKSTPTFPINTSQMFDKNYSIIRTTPYGNTMTLDMAKASVKNEHLGKNTVTDFLAISCSSTDYIGHKFGVNAIETEDTYLRLDRDLASFFSYLDAEVGKGNYIVFLSADHGAAHNPTFLTDHNIPAGTWPSGQTQKDLNEFLETKFNAKNVVISFSNSQVHFNEKLIKSNNLNEDNIRRETVKFLRERPGILFVADVKDIDNAVVPLILKNRIINGYNFGRSGPVVFILEPGWYAGSPNATGATHGSWNPYDTHIPLLFMGWGIQHGSTNRTINMTDISATIAALLHIQQPNGCIGKPISELFKK